MLGHLLSAILPTYQEKNGKWLSLKSLKDSLRCHRHGFKQIRNYVLRNQVLFSGLQVYRKHGTLRFANQLTKINRLLIDKTHNIHLQEGMDVE